MVGNKNSKKRAESPVDDTSNKRPHLDNGTPTEPGSPVPPVDIVRSPLPHIPVSIVDDASLLSSDYQLRTFDYIPAALTNERWWNPSIAVDTEHRFYPPIFVPMDDVAWGVDDEGEDLFLAGKPLVLRTFARVTKVELTTRDTRGFQIPVTQPGIRFECLRKQDHSVLRQMLSRSTTSHTISPRKTLKTSTGCFEWSNRRQIGLPWNKLYDGQIQVRSPAEMTVLEPGRLKPNDVVLLHATVQRFKPGKTDEEKRVIAERKLAGDDEPEVDIWLRWTARLNMHHLIKVFNAPLNVAIPSDSGDEANKVSDWKSAGLRF